jgi:hypothetical protein
VSATASRVFPAPLRGPAFGSYPADDVAWLLTDLSHAALEAPTAEREAAVQSGRAHYAESLPIEYEPSAQYLRLFEDALHRSARRVALAVGTVTELVLAERGSHVVLASLARAGTPVGILMRRWAWAVHGLDLPHYTLSIVRGRGIDTVALAYLADRHDPRTVVFVDGWTGKGAIARELAAAVHEANERTGYGYIADLAVLADPGSCVRTFGTRDDFLVPSACLNSTVSGLVSRTVLNDRLIGSGDFHGAKFYRQLAGRDVSGRFVDAVAARFGEVVAAASGAADAVRGGDREPTWDGCRSVRRVAADHGITNLHLVKPGVGETTRVLLRRVPWRVLINPDRRAELGHLLVLARERGVEVVADPTLRYSCVGLIRPSDGGVDEPA